MCAFAAGHVSVAGLERAPHRCSRRRSCFRPLTLHCCSNHALPWPFLATSALLARGLCAKLGLLRAQHLVAGEDSWPAAGYGRGSCGLSRWLGLRATIYSETFFAGPEDLSVPRSACTGCCTLVSLPPRAFGSTLPRRGLSPPSSCIEERFWASR